MEEKGIFALFRLKIRTWTTMPLKVGIIATFRGLLSDCSFPKKLQTSPISGSSNYRPSAALITLTRLKCGLGRFSSGR
jgi:hypothetical protein